MCGAQPRIALLQSVADSVLSPAHPNARMRSNLKLGSHNVVVRTFPSSFNISLPYGQFWLGPAIRRAKAGESSQSTVVEKVHAMCFSWAGRGDSFLVAFRVIQNLAPKSDG